MIDDICNRFETLLSTVREKDRRRRDRQFSCEKRASYVDAHKMLSQCAPYNAGKSGRSIATSYNFHRVDARSIYSDI